MNKRDDLIARYAADLKDKCGVDNPDMKLLTKVTIGLGPSIYRRDAATVSSSDPAELARVRQNFLIKKLGLKDSPKLDEGIDAVVEQYGRSTRSKYRAVIYYLLVKHFRKSKVYA